MALLTRVVPLLRLALKSGFHVHLAVWCLYFPYLAYLTADRLCLADDKVRADVENASDSMRSAALVCPNSKLSFWMCHGADASADHVQRKAPNSLNRRLQLTLIGACSVAARSAPRRSRRGGWRVRGRC